MIAHCHISFSSHLPFAFNSYSQSTEYYATYKGQMQEGKCEFTDEGWTVTCYWQIELN